jgi:hypothetical protein
MTRFANTRMNLVEVSQILVSEAQKRGWIVIIMKNDWGGFLLSRSKPSSHHETRTWQALLPIVSPPDATPIRSAPGKVFCFSTERKPKCRSRPEIT